MPDFLLTDSLKNPVDISEIRWSSASSLYAYLKSDLLHLVVLPDFLERKDKTLTDAAPDPLSFNLSAGHSFQLGDTKPEISVAPGAQFVLTVNATPESDLFDDDAFHVPAEVPDKTAYVGLSMTGSLDLGVGGSAGDLSFGVDQNQSITFQYLKAFGTKENEPSLGAATMAMLSSFVIPARVADLSRLGVNDVCRVSGQGALTVSGGVTFSVPVNPLASLSLPLGAGSIDVQDGAMAGVSVSLTLTGSYQIRVEKLPGGSIRLSYLKEKDTVFETDLTASAGVSVDAGDTDLLAKLLRGISAKQFDPKMLDGLQPDQVSEFTSEVKKAADHSMRAAMSLALSTERDKQTAFQYEIRTDLLDAGSSKALDRALKGDLRLLTALEETAHADGTVAPGIKLLNSVFSTARTKGASLHVNLLGIVNVLSISKLMEDCEFLFEPTSGDLTIKETAQSEKISAITDPFNRQAALRKAMFDSVLATTTYVVGGAVTMPVLKCEGVHFASEKNGDRKIIADFTNWFVALNLMSADERARLLSGFAASGVSTCSVRIQLDDAQCEALFFDATGSLRPAAEYLEIGREALKVLLDPMNGDIDRTRYQFLDNPATWKKAVEIGPSPQLGTLIPLSHTDARFNIVLGDITGDLYDIVWWADGMRKAGQALQQVRGFLAGRDPASLEKDAGFANQRDQLQKRMVEVIASSKLRFHEPFGLVCLFQAAGARVASGRLTAPGLSIDRTQSAAVTGAAG